MTGEPSRILVRAANWVGDAVMSLPALHAIRERFPAAHIAILARPWVADVYRRERFADRVIPCPAFKGITGWAGRRRLARQLAAERFDTAILLPNSFDSALLAWMARIPRRIGYDRDGRRILLSDALPVPRNGEIPQHQIFYYLELLRRAGLLERLPESPQVKLEGFCEARAAGMRLFSQMGFEGPFIGISPGAQNSRAKQWLPERFAESASRLASELGAVVAVFGSLQERTLAAEITQAIRRDGHRVLNVAGETTLGQFIDLAATCRVIVTNDSGAMHIGAALGVPTVAVFGPTEWFATGPTGANARIVREPVECSPCMLRDCPIDHRCMTRITTDRVVQAALEIR